MNTVQIAILLIVCSLTFCYASRFDKLYGDREFTGRPLHQRPRYCLDFWTYENTVDGLELVRVSKCDMEGGVNSDMMKVFRAKNDPCLPGEEKYLNCQIVQTLLKLNKVERELEEKSASLDECQMKLDKTWF